MKLVVKGMKISIYGENLLTLENSEIPENAF
jgi:hypothetical protein